MYVFICMGALDSTSELLKLIEVIILAIANSHRGLSLMQEGAI